jgi:hypothetical protein
MSKGWQQEWFPPKSSEKHPKKIEYLINNANI